MIPEPTEAMIEAGANEVPIHFAGFKPDAEALARAIYLAMEAAREPEAGKLREALEFGDAGDALDYALDHLRDSFEIMDFLECWREGRLTDWPGYIHWLDVQRKGEVPPRSGDSPTAESGDAQ